MYVKLPSQRAEPLGPRRRAFCFFLFLSHFLGGLLVLVLVLSVVILWQPFFSTPFASYIKYHTIFFFRDTPQFQFKISGGSCRFTSGLIYFR